MIARFVVLLTFNVEARSSKYYSQTSQPIRLVQG